MKTKPVILYRIYQMGHGPSDWVLTDRNGTICRGWTLKEIIELLPEEHR